MVMFRIGTLYKSTQYQLNPNDLKSMQITQGDGDRKSYIPASSPIAMFLTSTSWKHWTSSSRTSLHFPRRREFPRQSTAITSCSGSQSCLHSHCTQRGNQFPRCHKLNARHPGNGIIHSISMPSIHPSHTNLCALKTELKLIDLPLNSLTEQSTEIQSTRLQSNPFGVGLPVGEKVGTS